jgi:hypothetical protein
MAGSCLAAARASGRQTVSLEESVETNDETACLPEKPNPMKLSCCVTKCTDLKN